MICKACGRDMLHSDGCGCSMIQIGDFKYMRVKVGDQTDLYEDHDSNSRCYDCNALYGHYHHIGCDVERCPKCGEQLFLCDC